MQRLRSAVFAPSFVPVKLLLFGGSIYIWRMYQRRENSRYEFMEKVRTRNRLLRAQSDNMQKNISENLKDFDGEPIDIIGNNKEITLIYYGDFQRFFQIYALIDKQFANESYEIIYLTNSSRIKHLIKDVMIKSLPRVRYAYESNLDTIDQIGLKEDYIYFINEEKKITLELAIASTHQKSLNEYARLIKLKANNEKDKKFLRRYDFKETQLTSLLCEVKAFNKEYY